MWYRHTYDRLVKASSFPTRRIENYVFTPEAIWASAIALRTCRARFVKRIRKWRRRWQWRVPLYTAVVIQEKGSAPNNVHTHTYTLMNQFSRIVGRFICVRAALSLAIGQITQPNSEALCVCVCVCDAPSLNGNYLHFRKVRGP